MCKCTIKCAYTERFTNQLQVYPSMLCNMWNHLTHAEIYTISVEVYKCMRLKDDSDVPVHFMVHLPRADLIHHKQT
ncbi:unnamed protein product, partial [Ixodes pacificus]